MSDGGKLSAGDFGAAFKGFLEQSVAQAPAQEPFFHALRTALEEKSSCELSKCKLFCQCNLGPAEPDQGWCSALLAFDVESGSSNGGTLPG